MEILRASALFAPMFDAKLARMIERRFGDPNFPAELLLKDLTLVVTEADRLGLNTTVVQGIRSVLSKTVASGHARDDYASIHETVDPLSQNG